MRLRRPLKILGLLIAIPLAVAALALVGLWGAANTASGRAWIEDTLAAALSAPDAPAEVDGLSGNLPLDTRLGRLVLRDRDGAWLTLEDARLDWRPLALLSGRLEIAAVTAGRVELARLPAGPADAAAPEPAGDDADEVALEIPELPVTVRVQRLAVERIDLGQPVLGTAAVFSAEGQAAVAQGGEVRSRLEVLRVDGPKGRFRAEATYHRDDRTLDVVLALDAARGGLVADLLDLPEAGPSTVRLTGSGPIRDWRGRLQARFGQGAQVGADLRLRDFARADIVGEAEAGNMLPADLRPLLGGPVSFDLALARQDENSVTVERGRIETSTARLDLSGGLAGDGATLDASAELAIRRAEPFEALAAPARFADLRIALDAGGPLAAPQVDARVTAGRLGVPEAELTAPEIALSWRPGDALTRGRAELRVRSPRAAFALGALQGFDGAPLDLEVAGDLDLDTLQLSRADVRLALAETRLALDGGADLASGAGDAAFELSAPELAVLRPLIGLDIAGAGTLTGHAAFAPDADPMVQATVAGDLREVGFDTAVLKQLLHGQVDLATELAVAPDGALALRGLGLRSPSASLAGDLSFPGDFATLSGDLSARIPDAAVLSPALGVDLAGAAELQAVLSGPIDDPAVDADLTLADAAIAGQTLGRLTVAAQAETLASGAQGRIELAADAAPPGATEAATEFALTGDSFTLRALRADMPGLRLRDGRLDVPLGGGGLAARAELASDDLGTPLQRLAGLQAGGAAQLSLQLDPGADGNQRLRLDGRVDALSLAGDAVTAQSVTLSADLSDAFGTPGGQARIRLSQGAAGPASFTSLSLTAQDGGGGLAVQLRGEGTLKGPAERPLALAADATLADAEAGAERRVTLSRLDLEIGARALTLQQPATLRQGDGGLALSDLVLAAGDGRIRLDAERGPERVDAALEVSDLPLAYAELVLAQPKLRGRLNLQASLTGAAAAPDGTLDLQLDEFGTAATDLPPVSAELRTRLQRGRATLEGEIGGVGETPIRLTGQLPLALSLAPVAVDLPADAPVQGEVRWAGEVAPLMPLVPAAGHRLTGQGDLAFILGGTVGDPDLYGRAVLDGAEYENLETGTLLTGLTATVVGTGERVEVKRFEARAGDGGRLDLSGGVDVLPKQGFPIELELTARDARLVRLDYLTAVADADIAVTGSLQDMTVAGTVGVERAEVRPPSGLPPTVADLQVVTAADLRERRAAEEAGAPPPEPERPSRIHLDLTVEMPGQVFVRGSGLDSEWGGRLAVTGTAAQPIVDGQIAVRRGRLDFLGQAFDLEQGRIAFDGGREIDPSVDIAAVNSGDELTATVAVRGRASSPEIELSSQPPLPQDEILSRILFGKSASNLSSLEAAQLAVAAAELSAGGGGPGLLDRLRSFVGVDVLRVGSAETAGTGEDGETAGSTPTVEAGKYVTDDVFVGVEQGATADSSKVTVEVELTDNIAVESDVGATGSGNLGIKFQWDY